MATPGSGPETIEGKRASRKAESRKKKAKQRTGRLLDAAKEQARSALDNLKHRAREQLDKAQRVAERTYESARREARREHLTPEGARRAARETMREAQHAAQERIREAAQDKLKDVEGSLRRIGEAVTEAAKEDANRQNLGGFGKSSSSDQPGPDPTGREQMHSRAKSSTKTSIRKRRAARQSETKSSDRR